jgi:hypothetical protein
MGRSLSIKYLLNLTLIEAETGKAKSATPQQWRVKGRNNAPGFGKPSEANLAVWIKGFEDSTKAGGVNAHLGVLQVTGACIVDQDSGAEIASFSL